MSNRSVDELDRDLGKLEKEFPGFQSTVADIQKSLGSLPKSPDVASRLTALEKLPGQISAFRSRIDTLDATAAKLSEKVKWLRWVALGAAGTAALSTVGLTAIKIDMQLLKIDLTLWKKLDEKNVKWVGKLQNNVGKLRDSIFRERAATRRQQEDVERQAKEAKEQLERQAKEAEEKIQQTIKGLPARVGENEKAIDKIKAALSTARDKAQAARDDRTGLSSRHKGVDAQQPKVGPVAKDVQNLRKAVDELVASLAGI
ncbi:MULTISPECIES: hypothetical protein [unclassified Streptomyces]|uniref:hypothetical protein n=1 Tax=unclassified Streptomyces TaxID=2593676 RepID=UPI00403C670B